MDNIKNIVTGGIITLVIGGASFTFSQQDVINNFADDTGLSQEQAEQYVNNITEDDLGTFSEVGLEYVNESMETSALADDIDCVNFEYEWESVSLSCSKGKAQLLQIANTELSLGQAYIQLGSDNASENEMYTIMRYLDQLNSEYELEISKAVFDPWIIEEMMKTNSFNKSLMKSALESDN